MRSLGFFGAVILIVGGLLGGSNEANAQIIYRTARPLYYGGPAYYSPSYSYYGGWYPGSYQNNYGNYGAYHVMTPVWTGGYRYRYW